MSRGPKPAPSHLRAVVTNGNRIEAKPTPAPLGELVASIPDKPEHLIGAAADEWDRLVPELAKAGLMTDVYRSVMSSYCSAWGRYVEAENAMNALILEGKMGALLTTKNGNYIQHPVLAVANRAMEQMLKCAVEFGMTPSSLAKAERVTVQGDLFVGDG